ncbi:hypothetical protein SAMN05444008_105170 [Cnuella takakiae]|uniref:Uncharacterized protein n=1 Tax=Cnuella takakiae TaxID=1302690 RepID=A0A1M4ZD05_9BACT|nr:hypothetical protein BUE76_21980 [Cnuella takakiae]SHF15662.1 hypothetical protein SAMN05444008_105170 [Cnuella takakiae]
MLANNITDFLHLPPKQQVHLIECVGIRLGLLRYANGYTLELISMQNFYTEVWVDKEQKILRNLHAFTDTLYLDPYLELIDIESLLCAL